MEQEITELPGGVCPRGCLPRECLSIGCLPKGCLSRGFTPPDREADTPLDPEADIPTCTPSHGQNDRQV